MNPTLYISRPFLALVLLAALSSGSAWAAPDRALKDAVAYERDGRPYAAALAYLEVLEEGENAKAHRGLERVAAPAIERRLLVAERDSRTVEARARALAEVASLATEIDARGIPIDRTRLERAISETHAELREGLLKQAEGAPTRVAAAIVANAARLPPADTDLAERAALMWNSLGVGAMATGACRQAVRDFAVATDLGVTSPHVGVAQGCATTTLTFVYADGTDPVFIKRLEDVLDRDGSEFVVRTGQLGRRMPSDKGPVRSGPYTVTLQHSTPVGPTEAGGLSVRFTLVDSTGVIPKLETSVSGQGSRRLTPASAAAEEVARVVLATVDFE